MDWEEFLQDVTVRLGLGEEGQVLQAEGRAQGKACGPERPWVFQDTSNSWCEAGLPDWVSVPSWRSDQSWTPAQGNNCPETGLVTGQGEEGEAGLEVHDQ